MNKVRRLRNMLYPVYVSSVNFEVDGIEVILGVFAGS